MQRKSGKFVCQCPLGLIPHFYCKSNYGHDQAYAGFNALSGLYLISTGWYGILYGAIKAVSMPSQAYTSFLRDNGD